MNNWTSGKANSQQNRTEQTGTNVLLPIICSSAFCRLMRNYDPRARAWERPLYLRTAPTIPILTMAHTAWSLSQLARRFQVLVQALKHHPPTNLIAPASTGRVRYGIGLCSSVLHAIKGTSCLLIIPAIRFRINMLIEIWFITKYLWYYLWYFFLTWPLNGLLSSHRMHTVFSQPSWALFTCPSKLAIFT